MAVLQLLASGFLDDAYSPRPTNLPGDPFSRVPGKDVIKMWAGLKSPFLRENKEKYREHLFKLPAPSL